MKHLIEPEKRKKFGIAWCTEEVECWADAYVQTMLTKPAYDVDGKVFKSLPECVQLAIIRATNDLFVKT